MHPELLVQLKEALDSLTVCELDVGLCQSIRANSLALQVQWTILELRERFFSDHQLQPGSQSICKITKNKIIPKFSVLVKVPNQSRASRQAIRGALSDLFHFLRLPIPPTRFRQSLINWTNELVILFF